MLSCWPKEKKGEDWQTKSLIPGEFAWHVQLIIKDFDRVFFSLLWRCQIPMRAQNIKNLTND